jgi:hypothetical protein
MSQPFLVNVRIKSGPLLIDERITVWDEADVATLKKEAEETGDFEVVSYYQGTVRTGVEAIDLITEIREAAGGR